MSGHSKWSTIKREKGAKDAKRGAVFTKLGNQIAIAARSGADPTMNASLQMAIEKAKQANMPVANIQRAIDRVSDKNAAVLEETAYEAMGPGGIGIIIETATDNNNRTVANIRSYFNKCNGAMGTQGSVEFMFDHTCNFRIPSEGQDVEEMELEMIDFGVEEIFADEDGILMYAPFESFGSIQKELENRNIEILSSGFERIPQITKELTAEQVADVEKLLEKIEEDDDVMNVYHTMQE